MHYSAKTRFKRFTSFLLTASFTAILVTACGGGGGDDGGGDDGSDNNKPVDLGNVAALFPTNGADWNDYVSGDMSTATDMACDAAMDTACLHGGEARVVTATGKTSCSGLTAADALGAFNWTCDSSSGTAQLTSTGLADGMNLSDLIDFTAMGFRTNAVTVYSSGSVWGKTPASIWWSNPIEVNNDGGSLTAASTIVLYTSRPTNGYVIDADKIAIVAERLTKIGSPATGTAVFQANSDYFWLETGTISLGNAINSVLELNGTRFSTIRKLSSFNAGQDAVILNAASKNRLSNLGISRSGATGIFLNNASNNTFTNVRSDSNASFGIYLSSPSSNNLFTDVITNGNTDSGIMLDVVGNNTFTNVTASNNADNGVELQDADNNNFNNVTANNNATHGVFLQIVSAANSLSNVSANFNVMHGVYLINAPNNSLARIKASNNGGNGVAFETSVNNTASDLTVTNNSVGIVFFGASNNILTGATVANNGSTGIALDNGASNNVLIGTTTFNNRFDGIAITQGSNNNAFRNTAAINNADNGIIVNGSSPIQFSGLLRVGNNTTDCAIFGTVSGLDNTCSGSSATLATNVSLTNTFIGKITSDDSQNASDNNGTADFASIDPTTFDWSQFDNNYRSWGIEGSTFPNVDQTVRWTSGIGRIYDWSLATGDNGNGGNAALRSLIAAPTSGSETRRIIWDTPGGSTSICQAVIPGSKWSITVGGCFSDYLRGAIEISGDTIGNDNSLCESGETCLYTPNIGSYQGHGNLVSAGTVTNGTLSGITLLKYETNGY